MFGPIPIALFAVSAHAAIHHLAVGTVDGQALYTLEVDDVARSVYMIQARDAAGASPSLALDRSKQHLFSSRPSNGTLTRYSVTPTYEFVSEGTMEIPHSCNTTAFTSLHLSSSTQNLGIWGTASTGTCSVIFGLTADGITTLRSKEIAGDIHSIAWSPNGHSLHALDSHSSASSATSITNFHIADNPSLEDIASTDVLANVTSASQIVSHPTGNRVYLITKDTNELVTISTAQGANSRRRGTLAPSRYRILPMSLDTPEFHSSSLTITASTNTLWALSQSSNQAVIAAFSLNPTTGEVLDVAARATWKGAGQGQLAAAPFTAGDVVAITNSPMGYTTILGLDRGNVTAVQEASSERGHEYLQQITEVGMDEVEATTAKIMSYGRAILDDFINVGEGAWID